MKWTQSQAKHHTAAHSLLFGGTTEKSGRAKARKLVGLDNNSFITEEKRNKKSNYSEAITHYFPQADQCSASLLKTPLPAVFITEGGIIVEAVSLWLIWVSCVHSQVVAHPILLAMKAE